MVVIIADDERFVRRGIIENIPWDSYGIDTIIETRNGMDCLRKAEEFHPDILIADIRMPKLNGIDLGREISARYPGCRIIIISAYSEKEYLKSAISLNVIAYVEKPIVISELEAAVKKAVRKIREVEGIREEKDTYRLYEDLLSRKNLTGTARALLRQLGQNVMEYAVVIFSSRKDNLRYRDLKRYVDEQIHLQKYSFFIYQDILPHSYVLLAQRKETGEFVDDLVSGLNTVIHEMNGEFFVSVGSTVTAPGDIPASFEHAKQGNGLLFGRGYDSVVYVRNDLTEEEFRIGEEEKRKLLNYFTGGQKQEMLSVLHGEFDRIEEGVRHYSEISVKYAAGELLGQLLQAERNGPIAKLQIWEELFACRTARELREMFDRIVDIALPQDMVQDTLVKRMILLIVEEYARQELSISYICDRLDIGRSKACSIFKKETGKTINEYITEYRIGKAKKYLQDNMTPKDVAKMVGYHDSAYFSRIFKKMTGTTPASYRRRTGNG